MILDLTGLTLRRAPGDVDFSDLTRSRMVGAASWEDESMVIPFDVEPSASEQAAIRRRLLTADATEESTVTGLLAARTTLATDTTAHGKILRLLVNDRLRDIKE